MRTLGRNQTINKRESIGKQFKKENQTSKLGNHEENFLSNSSKNKVNQNFLWKNKKNEKKKYLLKEANKKLSEMFNAFENGKLSKNEFKSKIEGDLGLKTREKMEKVLSDSKIRFKDVVKNVELNSPSNYLMHLNPTKFNPFGSPVMGSTKSLRAFQNLNTTANENFKDNQSKTEVLSGLKDLITDKIKPEGFVEILKSSKISPEILSNDFREFKSSNTKTFRELGSKVLREICDSNNERIVNEPSKIKKEIVEKNIKVVTTSLFSKDSSKVLDVNTNQANKNIIEIQMRRNYNQIYINKRGNSELKNSNNGDIITWSNKNKELSCDYGRSFGVKRNLQRDQVLNSTLDLSWRVD